MAADHLKKRPNVSGTKALGHCRPKKKKLDSINGNFNSKSHVSLEWDELESKVIAKKDQISLSKRAVKPFGNSCTPKSNALADAISIPCDLLGLKSLNGILSYEVWHNKLPEKDRKLLSKFLPQNFDQNEIVEALLSGENFHFGNSFVQWSSKLCSGSLHPDTVYREEEDLKQHKRKHFSDVQMYHTSMIKYLQKLKKTWKGSKNPDLSKTAEAKVRNGDGVDDTAANSYSSWVEEDKARSYDNQTTPQRVEGTGKKKDHENSYANHDRLSIPDSCSNEGSTYMSYIKVSKKQYDLILNMKHSGKSFQSKSLRNILGTVDSARIHPYEDFGKEQYKKFQDNWLHLVNFDLPSTYAKWKCHQQQRNELMLLLCQGLISNPQHDKEDDCDEVAQNKVKTTSNSVDNPEGEDSESSEFDHHPQLPKIAVNDSKSLCTLNTEKHENSVEEYQEGTSASDAVEHVSSHSDGHGSNSMEASKNIVPRASEYSANGKNIDPSVRTVFPFSPSSDLFINSNSSICHNAPESSDSCVYGNVGYPSTRNIFPDVNNTDSSANNVGPESYLYHNPKGYSSFAGDDIEEEARKRALQRQNQDTSFSTYSTPDRSGLLQSLFSRQDLPYNSEPKEFRVANNMLLQDGVFSGNLHQMMAVDHVKKMRVENFMRVENSSGELYAESGGFPVPTQVNLPELMGPQFPQDSVLSQKWLCDGVSTDQSLYSVLSQCTHMRSDRGVDCGGSNEPMSLPRNYAVMRVGNNAVPQGHHPLEFLGGSDTGTSIESGWVNLPQNSSHDPLEKPFLRSWSQ